MVGVFGGFKFQCDVALVFCFLQKADESREIVKAFGVWGEKSFMGRKFGGIHRMSFLVGADGKIAKAYHKVKAKAHPDEVLADAGQLLD